jgi:enoyl-CoA hydratase/carnithine racemase
MGNTTKLTPPPTSSQLQLSFPIPHAILITFNRPKSLNAMTPEMTEDMERVMDWFENEEELWVAIFTGAGRLFCAGADLVAWSHRKQAGNKSETEQSLASVNKFASLSTRQSRKPLIAAVNGGAYGGGMEIVLNCDLVVASEDAKFALPEVKRGVVAFAGGIPRVVRIAGHQLASEMLLLGGPISAQDAYSRFHFVNKLVPKDAVLSAAIQLAQDITDSSPDSVQSTKSALLSVQNTGTVAAAFEDHAKSAVSERVFQGQNIKVGGFLHPLLSLFLLKALRPLCRVIPPWSIPYTMCLNPVAIVFSRCCETT